MNRTLLPIRVLFVALCAAAGWLVCFTEPEWDGHRTLAIGVGFLIGSLVVLVDVLLKGFSLRSLSAISFGPSDITPSAAPAPEREIEIPAGLTVGTRLDTALSSETSTPGALVHPPRSMRGSRCCRW